MDVFVVRVWAPASGERPNEELQGVVEHVASGTTSSFRDARELARLLRTPSKREASSNPISRRMQ